MGLAGAPPPRARPPASLQGPPPLTGRGAQARACWAGGPRRTPKGGEGGGSARGTGHALRTLEAPLAAILEPRSPGPRPPPRWRDLRPRAAPPAPCPRGAALPESSLSPVGHHDVARVGESGRIARTPQCRFGARPSCRKVKPVNRKRRDSGPANPASSCPARPPEQPLPPRRGIPPTPGANGGARPGPRVPIPGRAGRQRPPIGSAGVPRVCPAGFRSAPGGSTGARGELGAVRDTPPSPGSWPRPDVRTEPLPLSPEGQGSKANLGPDRAVGSGLPPDVRLDGPGWGARATQCIRRRNEISLAVIKKKLSSRDIRGSF